MAIALSIGKYINHISETEKQSVVKATVDEIDDYVSISTAVITEHFVLTAQYYLCDIFV